MQLMKRFSDPLTWISFLYHLLLLGTPFVFTWVNEELFEFPKMLVVYVFATLIAAFWAWKMITEKKILVAKTALDVPILLFLFSQILSTIFSIHPRTSIFGYYTRFNGGLLSTIAYILLYYAFVSNFEKKHLVSFLKTTLLGAFLTVLYAIPEHFGRSPSCLLITGKFNVDCWVQDVQNRVFASFGQPNWLAAYLITLLPLTLVQFSSKMNVWWPRILAVLMTVALLFTRSRSGFLGLGVALGLMGAVQLFFHRDALKNTILGGIAILVLTLIVGSPFSPSLFNLLQRKTAAVTPAAPAGTVLDNGGTDSGVIRQIVWKGALQVWKRYPIFGSGVETFAYSYYQDRPVEHNSVSEWDYLYNKAHNEFLNYLATTGTVGTLSYVLLLCWFGVLCLLIVGFKTQPTEEKQLALALLSGVVALSVSNFFGFSTVMVNVLLFWFMAVISIMARPNIPHEPTKDAALPKPILDLGHWFAFAAISVVVCVLLFQIYQQWWADRLFVRAKSLYQAGEYSLALDHFSEAIAAAPGEALYYDELAMDYGKLAADLDQTNETTAAAQLAETAIKASDYALQLNPRHLNFYKTRARVFINLSQIHPTYLPKAIEALKKAIELSPTDAKLYYNLALVQLASDKSAEGMVTLQKAVELKPDYLTARYELGKQWEALQQFDKATFEYNYILTNLSPNNPEVLARLAAVASASAQLKH